MGDAGVYSAGASIGLAGALAHAEEESSLKQPSREHRTPRPLDLARVRKIPIRERRNLVSHARFARCADPRGSFRDFFASLPGLLAAEALRAAVAHTAASVRGGRRVIAALGGHVVKVGVAPLLIDLMERGILHGVVLSGATAIHDYEVALIGETSEDVGSNIADGSFGMAHETAAAANAAAREGAAGTGLGRALGTRILAGGHPWAHHSLLAAAARLDLPATVHVAMGTDIVHMHPEIDGAAMGEATHIDFRILAAVACELEGGVWMNIGSAVVLPEVFLKVVNIARNLGHALAGLVAIDFDMQRHYRTSRNVLERPVARGFSILGHHEINLPLFRMALLGALEEGAP